MSTRVPLIIRQQQMEAIAAALGQDAVMPCARHWVAFQLVDEDGRPLPDVTYRIRLPGGSAEKGSLNEEGTVRFDDIDPGECEIRFPDLWSFGTTVA